MGPRACFVKMTLEIECRVLNDLKNDFFMCSGVVSACRSLSMRRDKRYT